MGTITSGEYRGPLASINRSGALWFRRKKGFLMKAKVGVSRKSGKSRSVSKNTVTKSRLVTGMPSTVKARKEAAYMLSAGKSKGSRG